MIRRPFASSSWARFCTSITWKGSMSAMRAARIKFASRFMGNRPRQYPYFSAQAHYAASRGESNRMRETPGAAARRNSAIMGSRNKENSSPDFPMEDTLRRSALEYHRRPAPGKISVTPTKGLVDQRDLALAYPPGVAAACAEIARDPAEARNMTSRGNLIGVVTNGTAVLGLGAIGPLAAKPVMEGKAVLFKKCDGIDCFDIEVSERDPEARRDHRGPGAHVRRNQPRGHQGSRVLPRREEAARANEDPGVSRRPARHRHHRRRRSAERAAGGGQGSGKSEARLLGRRGGGARLPRSAGQPGAESGQHLD